MINIEYNLYDIVIDLLIKDYNIDEISTILSLDKHFIIEILKSIKSLIINQSDESKFYIINIIDKLNNKYRLRTSLQNSYETKIYEDIFLSNEEIMNKYNLNIDKYLSILKSIYFEIYTYKIDYDQIKLRLIKERINELNYDIKNYKVSRNIMVNNDSTIIKDNDNNIISIDSPTSKIFDFNKDFNKFIVISDTHFGSLFENLDYLNRVYEYAIKNGIYNIFIVGDLIEGHYANYERCKNEYKNVYSQIDHVLKDYCYDKSISNYILLGNHDLNPLLIDNIDIYTLLDRKDFNLLGYRNAYIKVKDDYITMKHQVDRILNPKENNSTFLNLFGHSHQFRCSFNDNMIKLYIPTLSDLYSNKNYVINKGFIVGELSFNKDKISDISLEYINFDNMNYKLEKHIK